MEYQHHDIDKLNTAMQGLYGHIRYCKPTRKLIRNALFTYMCVSTIYCLLGKAPVSGLQMANSRVLLKATHTNPSKLAKINTSTLNGIGRVVIESSQSSVRNVREGRSRRRSL